MDINSILAGITGGAQQQVQQNAATAASYEADTARIQNLLTLNEQEAAAVATKAAETAAAEAQLTYKTNKAKEANAAIAGMNPDDLNNQYVRSLAEYDAAEEERRRHEAKYNKLSTVSLLDNPLGYLMAQLQLPNVAAQHNAALRTANAAEANIQTRVDLIKAKDSIIAANTADQALQINLDKAANAKQVADIQLRQAQVDNISKVGARAMESYRLTQDVYRIQRETLQTEMSVRQWQATQEAASEARKERAEAAKLRLEAANAKQEEIDQLNSRLAAASATLGYKDPFTLTTVKLLPKAKQDLLLQAALSGDFGSNLQESVATLKAVGNPAVISTTNAGMGKFMSRIENGMRVYADEATRQAAATGQKLKAGQAEKDGADHYQTDLINSAQSFASKTALNSKRWDDGGTFNPYKPEYLALMQATASGQIPALKDNQALQALDKMRSQLAPNATNFRGEDMERMVQVMAQQVADKKIGLDKASQDIAQLHQVAAEFNSQLYNYTQFGLPKQTSAIATVPGLAAFSDPQKLDMMNPASVKSALAKMASQSSAVSNMGMTASQFVPQRAGGMFDLLMTAGQVAQQKAAPAAPKQ